MEKLIRKVIIGIVNKLITFFKKKSESGIKNIERSIDNKMLAEIQREIIVRMFDSIDDVVSLPDMAQILRGLEYRYENRIIRDAIQEGLLYVDTIDEDGTVYLALTDWGEEMWEKYNE